MQLILYDKNTNTVRTSIKKPFFMASEVLGWRNRKSQGLGFNRQIINTCLENHAGLTVYVESTEGTYHISYESLKSFLDFYYCDYSVKSNVSLKIIAFDEFSLIEDQ